jgi:hypothetical protein
MPRIPHTASQVNRHPVGIACAPAGSGPPKAARPRRWAIAVAVAAVAVLALAACGGPGVEVVPTVAPTATPNPFASDRVSCTVGVRPTIEVLKEVKDRYRDRIFGIEGVNGLGVGQILENGERSHDKRGILVVVDLAQSQFIESALERLPETIEGCTVSVEVARSELVSSDE